MENNTNQLLMWQKDIAFYLGKEKETGFTGFIAEENFFLILTLEDGFDSEKGHSALHAMKEAVLTTAPTSLSEFEQHISKLVKENNIPMNFSLASGYLKDKILYLKTAGRGEIFIRRDLYLERIIQGENSASGKVQEKDILIFTTQAFTETIGGQEELRKIFDHKRPHEIVDDLTPTLKRTDDSGLICLFVQFSSQIYAAEPTESEILEGEALIGIERLKKNKTLTLAAVVLISIILLWSVVLGYQRRNSAGIQAKIKSSRFIITQELTQAEEVSFLNLPRAQILLAEAKTEVSKLKKEIGNRKEVQDLEKLISDKENLILKKEEKSPEEFFDLTVDSKKAKGDSVFLDSDTLNILDSGQGTIYQLSLSKKSLNKKSFPEIKSGKKVVSYQDNVIFFTGEAFYLINSDGNLKKVIDKDSDWSNIADIWDYNGNIYGLDAGRGTIYKYLAGDNAFASKSAYFKSGQTNSLTKANSLAIDSSVYVGLPDTIFKFTQGEQDDFKISFPENNVQMTSIFTSKEVEKVYAWDKANGRIYILNKTGAYEREITSDILKKANDFAVYANTALVLIGPKIYKINLD